MTAATAVVVTYRSAAVIGAALTALSGADVEIIVVDNDSDDHTVSVIARDFPEVGLIVNSRNVGFAAAVNQGLERVCTPAVLLVNPDCVVPPDTVRGLLEFLDHRPDAGVVGPRLTDLSGRIAISAHPFETFRSVVLSRFGGSLLPVALRRLVSGRRRRAAYDTCRAPGPATSVDWVSGACLAVRTDLLRGIGGLDERYFLYYEDEELCWQSASRGAGVFHLPAFTAVHIGGASSEHGATWPHLYRSMLLFFALHRPRSYRAVRVAILVRAGLGMVLGALRGRSGRLRVLAWRQVAGIALGARVAGRTGDNRPTIDEWRVSA